MQEYLLKQSDVFAHLNHTYYLCKGFTRAQRIKSALTHYLFEEAQYTSAYRKRSMEVADSHFGRERFLVFRMSSTDLFR